MEFKEIVNKRYATKKFDGKKISSDKLGELLELIRLAPSSFGLQPWVIKIVEDQNTKDKLMPASWNQPQINTCSHLLVFCANSDIKSRIQKYSKMMCDVGIASDKVDAAISMMSGFEAGMSSENKLNWAKRQVYIALANAVNGAKSLGFDSCPMEGFSSEEYSKILDLPNNLVPTVLVAVGYAADKPHGKLRFSKKDLFI